MKPGIVWSYTYLTVVRNYILLTDENVLHVKFSVTQIKDKDSMGGGRFATLVIWAVFLVVSERLITPVYTPPAENDDKKNI